MLLRVINLNASWKLSSWAPLCRTECRPSRVWLFVSHKSKFPLQPEDGGKKKKKSRRLFSVDVKTYWTCFIPSLFMHYSNKSANEVGKVGLATIFMVPTLYGERAAKDNWCCFTGNREKPLKAASNMKLFADRMSMYRIAWRAVVTRSPRWVT